MSYLDWKVGDNVFCVDASNTPGGKWFDDAPVVGREYTLAAIYVSGQGYVAVRLVELQRSARTLATAARNNIDHSGYRASRFRKVHPRKTSIAIFEQMLHPSKQGVDA